MAYNALNNLIDAYIYPNGVQAITGSILNNVLKTMVSQLGGGYNLMGVAAPASSPAVNDEPQAYFAATAGTYMHFDGIVLAAGEVAVLLTSGNGSWSKQTIYNVPTGTADLANTAGFITDAVNSLVNYYTKTEIDTALSGYTTTAALATALADYYNKAAIDAQMATRYTKSEVDTKLGDYYRKTETYDKDEVDSIVAAISRQEYIVAWDGLSTPDESAIPAGVTVTYSGTTYTGTLAASASTVNKIYMVWNGTAYDMYGTSADGGYSWVPMGTTTVSMEGYATEAEVERINEEIFGGRTEVRTMQGTGADQFFNLSALGYPDSGNTFVYFRVTNPSANFAQYGLGQGNGDALINYRDVTWVDQANGLGYVGIQIGFSQLVITSAVSSSSSVTILSAEEAPSLKSRVTTLESRVDTIQPLVNQNVQAVQSLTGDVSEISRETALLKQSVDGGRAIMAIANGNGTDQFFNREDVGYPMSQYAQYVYFQVENPAANFDQYGMGCGNDGTLATYSNVEWLDQPNGYGRITITNPYTQIFVTAAVRAGTVVKILSADTKASIDSKLETQSSDINAVNGRITGGETVLRTMTGNGSDQVIPLSTLGMKRPEVYLYFRVSGQASNFAQYGLGYSNNGKTFASYTNVTWVDEEEGYGYIVVLNKDYIVLTSANGSGVSIRFLDVSWNPGIEKQVFALNQRVFGGHRVVFSIEGNGTNQFIKLDDYGITPDENGRYYIKVENPSSDFNQYGISSSDDGATLKQYRTIIEDGDEKFFTCDTPYIAVTFAVILGTTVSFYSRHEDGVGAIYNHPAIVSFIDDDTGVYVPEIWGRILAQSPIRMGFACITGFMSGLSAQEIYEQMTTEQLKALYDEGHEVYSHSYTHPAFYDSSVTVDQISDQCRRSKDWLLANGYFRGSDIIVYPGGLGDNKPDKENVVRRFYKYGVDTTGYGVNEEPLIERLRVKRFNADTATLAELETKVDEAIATGHLLVFMNHAYELNRDKEAQIAKMVSIIEYIKATSAIILPLGEALNQIYGI